MSKIKALINYINSTGGIVPYKLVRDKAYDFDENWKQETWSRGLRDSKLINPIKNDKGYITGYKYVGAAENLDKLSDLALKKSKKPVEPLYITKQREDALKRQNSPQKTLF